jgi:hypothetical protein
MSNKKTYKNRCTGECCEDIGLKISPLVKKKILIWMDYF